jgi:hypothetical protein
MTETQAKRIGSRQALKSAFIGIVIAQAVVTLLFSEKNYWESFFWFATGGLGLNIAVGVFFLFLFGYIFGRMAGVAILIKKRNFVLIGILTGAGTLFFATFLASWVGFFKEGIHEINKFNTPFYDYIFKPMYWINIFGFIPVIIVGIWLGWSIKKKGNKIAD